MCLSVPNHYQKVTWDEYSYMINGKRLMLFSGEVHPYRYVTRRTIPSHTYSSCIPATLFKVCTSMFSKKSSRLHRCYTILPIHQWRLELWDLMPSRFTSSGGFSSRSVGRYPSKVSEISSRSSTLRRRRVSISLLDQGEPHDFCLIPTAF